MICKFFPYESLKKEMERDFIVIQLWRASMRRRLVEKMIIEVGTMWVLQLPKWKKMQCQAKQSQALPIPYSSLLPHRNRSLLKKQVGVIAILLFPLLHLLSWFSPTTLTHLLILHKPSFSNSTSSFFFFFWSPPFFSLNSWSSVSKPQAKRDIETRGKSSNTL